uniref:Reverse transcriptase domain-containing protein n=1 Tax=Lactuca sativa TaxID=4236 RepID=A0A9R1VRD4_LACSA|nr:hypothetical protein LSAT_V11C400184290 [Lactuca sativa]
MSEFTRSTEFHQIYIDNDSCSDILYGHCFRQLLNAWKEGLQPPSRWDIDKQTPWISDDLCRKHQGATLSNKKRGGHAADRNRAINADVADLVNVDILWEVMFPMWIANLVMVKKVNGSWRMCIDYSNLNNTYSKDCYPLSVIDQNVQSLEGFLLKCFLDAYKGYHQVFADQIGRNIEVHTVDMVTKSRDEETLLQDVEETFRTLVRAQTKLNPAMCTFGVNEGQFLGYQVSKEGILPNTAEIQEFLESKAPPPQSQRGTGDQWYVDDIRKVYCQIQKESTSSVSDTQRMFRQKQFKGTKEVDVALQKLKDAQQQP